MHCTQRFEVRHRTFQLLCGLNPKQGFEIIRHLQAPDLHSFVPCRLPHEITPVSRGVLRVAFRSLTDGDFPAHSFFSRFGFVPDAEQSVEELLNSGRPVDELLGRAE